MRRRGSGVFDFKVRLNVLSVKNLNVSIRDPEIGAQLLLGNVASRAPLNYSSADQSSGGQEQCASKSSNRVKPEPVPPAWLWFFIAGLAGIRHAKVH